MSRKANNPRVRRQLRALDRFKFSQERVERDSEYKTTKMVELAALQAIAARVYA